MSASLPDPELGFAEIGKAITVRLADTSGKRNAARMLINRRYAWRGYGDQHQLPASCSTSTFTASSDSAVIGTITLAVDMAKGLAADAIFQDEIDRFRRAPGAKVCELTKLAFDAGPPSKPLLASLFHIVFIYGHRKHGCTDLFIEVNPRHRRFYEAMLGFTPIGDVKTNLGVDAPAQLMWLEIATIRRRINALGGLSCGEQSRTLYPFFFSGQEEDAIYERLTGPSFRDHTIDEGAGVRFMVPHAGASSLSVV